MFIRDELNQSITNIQATKQKQEDKNYCLHERGLDGYWLQDWRYANRTNYPNHGSYSNWHLANQKFTSTQSQPFRLATSFRWVDKKCPVHEVNVEEFCNSFMVLGLNQVLIMGDSLSIEFTQALQSLLGFPPVGRRATSFNARFKPWTMTCPSPAAGTITFLLLRMSPLSDWENLARKARETQTGQAYEFINKSRNKTAVIANLGAWMQTTSEYEMGFRYFLEWLRYLNNPDKIMTFSRPTIPGHFGCLPSGEKGGESSYNWTQPVFQYPYKHYSEYDDMMKEAVIRADVDTNRWELFESWNTWTLSILNEIDRNGTEPNILAQHFQFFYSESGWTRGIW